MAWRPEMQLYPYQQRAAEVMTGYDVLLAFDMGTGKTPTSLWAIEKMREEAPFDTAGTIVAPASLKWQWADEIARFTDQKAVVVDGPPAQRRKAYVEALDAGYLIMTYDVFVRDWALHRRVGRAFLLLDEATAIKNYKSKRSAHIKRVRGWYGARWALSGMPVENGNASEIYSIMEFVDPRVLGPLWPFLDRYTVRNEQGWVVGHRNLKEFHYRLRPSVLRATHAQPEVAQYLPKVQHLPPVRVRLDTDTARVAGIIRNEIYDDLADLVGRIQDGTAPDHPDGYLMSKIQVLRMLLSHPEAVRDSTGSAYAAEIRDRGLLDRLEVVPKQDAVMEYVREFLSRDRDNKVVVFSSFVVPAEQLRFAMVLEHRVGMHPVMITGSMSSKERAHAVRDFRYNDFHRVFISTDVGGHGLNLPEANLVINYDLPWQAGMLKQRNARIKRASSKWGHVTVQDFVVADTIEERLLEVLEHKNAISEAIIDGLGITEGGDVATRPQSLRRFLEDLMNMEDLPYAS